MKDFLLYTLFTLIFIAFFFAAFLFATSAEVWYADRHDAKCETLRGADSCNCYDRFTTRKGN